MITMAILNPGFLDVQNWELLSLTNSEFNFVMIDIEEDIPAWINALDAPHWIAVLTDDVEILSIDRHATPEGDVVYLFGSSRAPLSVGAIQKCHEAVTLSPGDPWDQARAVMARLAVKS